MHTSLGLPPPSLQDIIIEELEKVFRRVRPAFRDRSVQRPAANSASLFVIREAPSPASCGSQLNIALITPNLYS